MNLISDRGAIGSSCKATLNDRVVDGEAAITAKIQQNIRPGGSEERRF